jgi:hypothetical protein
MACSPLLAVITAVTTSITRVRRNCKPIVTEIRLGDGQAMGGGKPPKGSGW